MRTLLILLPFIVGFSKSSHELKSQFRIQDWHALRAHMLLKSKSLRQMDMQLARLDQFRREYEVCQQQLDLRSVPLKCFDVLERERSLGLINKAQAKGMYELLNKVCEDTVKDIQDLEDSRFDGLKKRTVSPKCRTALSQRFDVLRYKSVESNPKAVFDLRWQ